jgi:S-adenosyl-L-methionine hydrolase (adenosine-forming)
MPIITLTTDWGYRDYYAAAVKGRILSLIPDASIVDISHGIESFNTGQAAYVLKNAFPSFPAGTIHMVGVNSIAGIHTPHTLVRIRNQWFLGADNGLFSLLCSDPPEEIWEIDMLSDTDYFTFPERDIFPQVAKKIAEGIDPSTFGNRQQELRQLLQFEPIVTQHEIRGKIIYIDQYHNAITNISESLFRTFIKGGKFEISVKGSSEAITKVSKSYDDEPEGEKVALFNSAGYLLIAMNKGSGCSLFGYKADDPVMVERR